MDGPRRIAMAVGDSFLLSEAIWMADGEASDLGQVDINTPVEDILWLVSQEDYAGHNPVQLDRVLTAFYGDEPVARIIRCEMLGVDDFDHGILVILGDDAKMIADHIRHSGVDENDPNFVEEMLQDRYGEEAVELEVF